MKIRRLFQRLFSDAGAAGQPAPKLEVQQKIKTPIDLLHEAAVRESFATFRDHMEQALLFPQKGRIRSHCIERAISNFGDKGLYLEFGVFRAEGLNMFAKKLARRDLSITGFDSLRGLSEDWTGNHNGREAGAYSVKGKMPALEKNATLRAGWVEDTLPAYMDENPSLPIAFAHMDFDTYTPTAFALAQIKPRLAPGSILLFDELYGYPGWRQHEYKALTYTLSPECYRFICFSKEAVGIEITKSPQSSMDT
ncbi:MAG: class I SAM-dependent methyltransferase [Pseudomonadota bacterium]